MYIATVVLSCNNFFFRTGIDAYAERRYVACKSKAETKRVLGHRSPSYPEYGPGFQGPHAVKGPLVNALRSFSFGAWACRQGC